MSLDQTSRGERCRRQQDTALSADLGGKMIADMLVSGVPLGCLYALVAVSYNILYRPTNVFNFAQGDLVMLGALITATLLNGGGIVWPLALFAAPNNRISRALRGSRANGASRSRPKSRDSACSASRTSLRSPRAQGAMAPLASAFDSSGTTRCGSKSMVAPSP